MVVNSDLSLIRNLIPPKQRHTSEDEARDGRDDEHNVDNKGEVEPRVDATLADAACVNNSLRDGGDALARLAFIASVGDSSGVHREGDKAEGGDGAEDGDEEDAGEAVGGEGGDVGEGEAGADGDEGGEKADDRV